MESRRRSKTSSLRRRRATGRSSDILRTVHRACRPLGSSASSLTEAHASTLLGVFVSVTTIPAASDIAVSLAFTDRPEAWGSLLRLLLNVVVLVIVGFLTLRVQRRLWRRGGRGAAGRSAPGPRLTLSGGPLSGRCTSEGAPRWMTTH
ncbi:DUF389 domain-containing protein [Streptomyces massasporeus]|uniref:DUF389 domain-containing protein n=1 Tax=Streptomyces massasporeus TaxID=67324 RepID=UPI0033C7CEF4